MYSPDLIPAGIVRCDAQSRVEAANATMLRWAGRTDMSDIAGRPFYAFLAPAGRIYFETHIRPMLMVEGKVQEIALELLTPTGKRRRIYLNGQAERDSSGSIKALHFACFSGGHRQSYERELLRKRRDAEGYVALVKSSADAILNADKDGKIAGWNAAAERLFGYSEGDVVGRNWRSLLLPNEPHVPDAPTADRNTEVNLRRAEADARHASGDCLAVEYHEAPVLDEDGATLGTVIVLRDIRERRAAEETIKALNEEIIHRSKNQFSVIQAIARSTARHSSPDDFVDVFIKRLDALSRNMTLLKTSSTKKLELSQLVESQLAHLSEAQRDKISTNGPEVELSENLALYLGLALFELSTNAIKYGALSGRASAMSAINISWILKDNALRFEWTETGMTSVSAPSHHGFGSQLIGPLFERSTKATVTANYNPSGLTWQFQRDHP